MRMRGRRRGPDPNDPTSDEDHWSQQAYGYFWSDDPEQDDDEEIDEERQQELSAIEGEYWDREKERCLALREANPGPKRTRILDGVPQEFVNGRWVRRQW